MTLFSWLIVLPALSGAASTLLFGKLSDIYGRRAILLLSIGLFVVGLGIATLATTMAWLVAAATFMSIGHFPIIPLCFSAIGDLFAPTERAKWTGLVAMARLSCAEGSVFHYHGQDARLTLSSRRVFLVHYHD